MLVSVRRWSAIGLAIVLLITACTETPASDPRSSCQLQVPVTEFQCQGLELDMPLLSWGDDLGWEGG